MSGRGTVKQDPKTKRWFFVVDVAPAGAPRKQVRRTGFATKTAAVAELGELLGDVKKSGYVVPTNQTLDEYLDEWLDAKREQLAPSTHASYSRYLKVHARPALGAIPLRSLDALTLTRFYGDLRDHGRRGGKPGGLSVRSVRYIHTILRSALADAGRRIPFNPADDATVPKASRSTRREMRTWSGGQVAAFLEAAREHRYYPVWFLLATTGARRGEVLGLRWSDIEWEGRRAQIRQTVTSIEHVTTVASRTKTDRSRAIDLDTPTVELLRAHRARQAEDLLKLGRRADADGLVFCEPTGAPLDPESVSRAFERLVVRLEIEPAIRLHDLRHTWATLALAAGVAVKIVSERLGHSSAMITLDIYSHVTPTMGSDAAEQVAGVIFGTAHHVFGGSS